MLLSIFLFPLLIAVAAVIYKMFLPHQDILGWWFVYGARFERRWFYKPIWGCVYCVAGQLALWCYIITWILSSNLIQISILRDFIASLVYLPGLDNFSALMALFFVSLTLAYTKVFVLLYSKYFD